MLAPRLAFLLLLGPLLAGCADPAPGEEAPSFVTLGTAAWKERLDATTGALVLDVRTPEEYAAGHITNATLLPYTEVQARAGELPDDRAIPLFVYCRSGNRSGIASEALVAMGYTNVVNMRGGYPDWAAAGYPTSA